MEISYWEAALLIICFFSSGFFSGSEAVLMSIDIDRAKQLIENGGSKGRALQFMVERPSELLSTILIGNNIVNIFAASLTTAIFSRIFASDAIGYSVGVTTIIILIFGEIIPKTFARTNAENLSTFVIRVLQAIYFALYPIVKLTVWIIETFLGENAELTGRLVKKQDIEYLVNRAEKEQSIDSKQIDLLNSILEFPKIKVKDIMVARKEIKYIKKGLSYLDIMRLVEEDKHSRYPVVEEELENTIGFLHVKDLAFVSDADRPKFDIESILKEPFFVYEHMKIQAVFDYMNRKKVHLALVKDENSIVVGIITLEDIVEEILGEIEDEHDAEDLALEEVDSRSQSSSSGILVDGTISLRDLYSDFDIKIPLNDNYSTLAGFILEMLGNNFPQQGQIIFWEGYSFELVEVDDFEVREIKITKVDDDLRSLDDDKDEVDRREVVISSPNGRLETE